jgi:hypothetical protein
MLEALLEPANARAVSAASVLLAGNDRPPGTPDERVLAILRGIPEVECLLRGTVVASWHASFGSLHSRRWHRVAYDKPLLITPLDDVTERPSERAFVVQARDLSLAGLSFCHPHPLASRKVIVRFRAEDPAAGEGILAVLRWCRCRRDGTYQSGGQFARCVPLDGSYSVRDWECPDTRGRVTECSPAF